MHRPSSRYRAFDSHMAFGSVATIVVNYSSFVAHCLPSDNWYTPKPEILADNLSGWGNKGAAYSRCLQVGFKERFSRFLVVKLKIPTHFTGVDPQRVENVVKGKALITTGLLTQCAPQ